MSITAADYQTWVANNWNRLSSRNGTLMDAAALRELFIMAVGIGGEAGEVQELLKKHVRDGREIRDDLLLELGDVLHYLTRIAHQFGFTLDQVMTANRDKIEARHAKRQARAEVAHV
jgi:NTP pyrophosphatase (non-canonical NTP hydrolase)